VSLPGAAKVTPAGTACQLGARARGPSAVIGAAAPAGGSAGYEQPAEDWIRWNVEDLPPPDGPCRDTITAGPWRRRRMEGTWTRTAGAAVGSGRGAIRHGDRGVM